MQNPLTTAQVSSRIATLLHSGGPSLTQPHVLAHIDSLDPQLHLAQAQACLHRAMDLIHARDRAVYVPGRVNTLSADEERINALLHEAIDGFSSLLAWFGFEDVVASAALSSTTPSPSSPAPPPSPPPPTLTTPLPSSQNHSTETSTPPLSPPEKTSSLASLSLPQSPSKPTPPSTLAQQVRLQASISSRLVSNAKDFITSALCGRASSYLLLSEHANAAVIDAQIGLLLDEEHRALWRVRGQAHARLGAHDAALHDLSKAIELGTLFDRDASLLYERGLVFVQLGRFERAMSDLKASVAGTATDKRAWFQLGVCCHKLGRMKSAVAAYEQAVALDHTDQLAVCSLGLAYLEHGRADRAQQAFSEAIAADPTMPQAFLYRAHALFMQGEMELAQRDCERTLELLGDIGCPGLCEMLGKTHLAMGQFEEAMSMFQIELDRDTEHMNHYSSAWYLYSIAYEYRMRANEPFVSALPSYSEPDLASAQPTRIFGAQPRDELSPHFKDAHLKKRAPCCIPVPCRSFDTTGSLNGTVDSHHTPATPEMRRLFDAVAPLCPLFEYRAPGFLSNLRLRFCCSIGACYVAQLLRASSWNNVSWRVALGGATRWLCLSAPASPTYWLDELPPQAVLEGVEHYTYFLSSDVKMVKYASRLGRALNTVKQLMLERMELSEEQRRDLESANDVASVYAVYGSDIFVEMKLKRQQPDAPPFSGGIMGVEKNESGYAVYYMRRVPSARFADFFRELDTAWQAICDVATAEEVDRERLLRAVLVFYYYWVHLGFIVKTGTAKVGFTIVHAVLLAAGFRAHNQIPIGAVPDCEALLATSPDEFLERATVFLSHDSPPKHTKLSQHLKVKRTSLMHNLPDVASVCPNVSACFALLRIFDARD